MAPRAAVRDILGADAEMNSYDLVKERLFSSESPDTVERDKRWGVIRWLDRAKAFEITGARLMEVWVYQPKELGRDYGTIDAAIDRVKELITQAEQVPGADGWTFSGAIWDSDSPDLTDEGFNALTRFSRFRVAGRSIVTP